MQTPTKVYDAYLEIGDIDKAGRYGVTVNGMKITAVDKAAKQEILFIAYPGRKRY